MKKEKLLGRRMMVLLTIGVLISNNIRKTNAQGRLPERAFDIQSGSIGIQAGVMRSGPEYSAQKVLGPLMGKKDITYFIKLIPETDATIWPEVKLYLNKKPVKFKNPEIKPGQAYIFYWETTGVKKDAEIPLEISIYGDKKLENLLGSEKTFLYFESDDVEAFLKAPFDKKKGVIPVISGWREMKNTVVNVPGTQADARLQQDIIWKLNREESRSHRDCEHTVLKVEPYDAAKSVIAEKMGDTVQQLEERLRSAGDILLEKWYLKSCDDVNIYEVLMLRSPQGGTDILVEKIGRETSQQ